MLHSCLVLTNVIAGGITHTMSILRKVSTSALRNFKPRSGHSEGGYFDKGAQEGKNGILFGETPPPPGRKRKWESWEAPW